MRNFFATALITFMSASAIRLTETFAEIDTVKQYVLKYDHYNRIFDTKILVLDAVEAWNSGDTGKIGAFISFA